MSRPAADVRSGEGPPMQGMRLPAHLVGVALGVVLRLVAELARGREIPAQARVGRGAVEDTEPDRRRREAGGEQAYRVARTQPCREVTHLLRALEEPADAYAHHLEPELVHVEPA